MTMTRIRITGEGIKGGDTPVPVGTEFVLTTIPKAWEGNYEIVSEISVEEARAAETRAATVRLAADGLGEDDLTADGRPKVGALNAALPEGSEPVTVDERDGIWP